MKKFHTYSLFLITYSFSALASFAALTVSAPFDPKGGHIQGMCEDANHYYLAQMTRLFKVDKQTGKGVKFVSVPKHTGDLCFWNGHVYTAVSLYEGPDKGKGKVQVFDTELNLVREKAFDRGLDGITFFKGSLYVGRGSHLETVPHKDGAAPVSKTPHRENELLVLDAETLAIKEHRVYSHGQKTRYGAQNMTSDGTLLYVTFYPGESGAPDLVAYDAALNPVSRYRAKASNGLQFGKDADGNPYFVKCLTKGGKGKPFGATIERIAFVGGVPLLPRVSDVVIDAQAPGIGRE